MKKMLLALPLFAGASWAGTTYYSGAQTEPAYNRLLEQLNSSSMLIMKSKEYDAGFMNSTAVTEVRAKDDTDSEVLFSLKHKINHSPVSMVPETARFGAANIITTLVLDDIQDEELKQFLESFDTGEPFVMTTDVAMDGATTSEIKINGIEHTNDGTTLKTDGSVINVVTSADGNVTGDGLMEKFRILDESNQNGEMSNLKLDFSVDRRGSENEAISKFFYDLAFDISIEEAKVVDANNDDKELVVIKDAIYSLDQKLTQGNPHMKFNMGINSIASDEIPLKSVNFDTALTGFSVTELMENIDFFAKVQASDEPEDVLFSEEGLALLRATFKPDTKLSMNSNASLVNGDIDAALNIWFTGNGSDDGYTGMVTTGDLAKAFAGTVVINADKAALMSTPLASMIEEPLAQHYLTITEDSVTLNANLDKLVLQVDDQVLPLELMAGEMLQMPLEMLLQM